MKAFLQKKERDLFIPLQLLAKWTFMPASEQELSLFVLSITMDTLQLKFLNIRVLFVKDADKELLNV